MTRKIFWAYTIVIVLMVVIPINNNINYSLDTTNVAGLRLDQLLHIILLLLWMVLIWKAYDINFFTGTKKALLILILALFFAAGVELIQYFLPYRACNIKDLLGNIAGVMIGSVIFFKKPKTIRITKE